MEKTKSSNYWIDRALAAQDAIAEKTVKDIEKQLKKYYASAMKRTIYDFERTFDKLMAAVEDGKEPTPADLYKLDTYWQTQAQMRQELQKLGDKEIALFSKKFEAEWIEVYEAFALPSDAAFATASPEMAKQMINSVWVADGKTFSQRIWKHTEQLTEMLNEHLTQSVITGKKTTQLKNLLMVSFDVAYNKADALVRTEAAHIQTQAAAQRYKDYGLKRYEFLGREAHESELKCNCKKLNGQKFYYSELQEGKNAPPLHPRCRCAIIPVIEDVVKKGNG